MLALIAAVVVMTIVTALARASVDEARSTAGATDRAAAYYAANAGIWVAGRDLADGGTGDLLGQLGTPGHLPVTGADADGDGFVDFAPVEASVAARAAGAFQARALDEGDGVYRLRARGVQHGFARVLEAVVSIRKTAPFQFGLFGAKALTIRGTVTTDGYDSRTGPYLAQPVTAKHGPHLARGHRGHIASDGNVTLDGSATIFGDVFAGGAITTLSTSSITGTRGVLSPLVKPARPTWSVPQASDPDLRNATLGLSYDDPLTRTAGVTVVVPGKYVVSSLHLSSSGALLVTGSPGEVIEIFVTGSAGVTLDSNAVVEVVPPGRNGPTVVIRTEGPFVVDTNAILNGSLTGVMGDPAQVQVYSRFVSASALGVRLDSDTRTAAAIYAPSAPAQLASNAELFGAVVSSRLDLSSNPFVHFDEALRDLVPPAAPTILTILSLREVR